MSPTLIAVICFILLFFLLLVVGIPVAFSLGIAGMAGLWIGWGMDVALSYLQTTPYTQVAHYTLAAVPLFLLMGRLIYHGGLSRALYSLAYKWVGRLPGGLAMATCVASASFAAVSGSSTATVASLAPITMPEMERYNYDKRLALGVLAASGTFAIMIPPSITFIVYGLITETSIGRLFIAGIFPGLLSASVYLSLIFIWSKLNPKLAPLAPKETVTWKERIGAIGGIWHVVLLLIFVLGGIYFGVMTVNESAAIGAVGALAIAMFRQGLSFRLFRKAIKDAVTVAAMVFMVIIGAFIFGYLLTLGKIPQALMKWIGELAISRWIILSLIVCVYIFLGTFMDQIAIQLLTLPITFPIVTHLGFEPIWFGVIIVKTTEIGLITPPLGLNVYILKGVSGEKLETVFFGILPFLIADTLTLITLILFPQISLYLPGKM
jgi:tripartite ATP-independent transporter DctM subunit